MVIFHSYVSLPEGSSKKFKSKQQNEDESNSDHHPAWFHHQPPVWQGTDQKSPSFWQNNKNLGMVPALNCGMHYKI